MTKSKSQTSMTVEKVYSPVQDSNLKDRLLTSPIWENCFKENEEKPKGKLYCYTIRFEGLKPVQLNKTEEIEN
jgi:hypothetical protein